MNIIDELGEIREQIKKLESREKKIVEMLKQELSTGKSYSGEQYEAKKIINNVTVLDPYLVKDYLGDENKFLQIVTIDKINAKKVIPEEELHKLSKDTGKTITRIIVSKKEKQNLEQNPTNATDVTINLDM